MQISEFIEANNRLEHYYEKEYTTEQRQIMYEELKDLSIERYKKLISECIKTCKFMPKVADIIKANTEYKEQILKENEKQTVECTYCNRTGYITFNRIYKNANSEINYKYAARCICENGKFANQKIKTFQELNVKPRWHILLQK